jgi:hypothetical protein
MKNTLILFFALSTLLFACDKDKRYSNKFEKEKVWKVSKVSIDNNVMPYKGNWIVSTETRNLLTDIYAQIPSLKWEISETNESILQWQFNEKGEKFYLSYLNDSIESNNLNGQTLDSIDYFAYSISGFYDVIEYGRKKIIFKSIETIGHSGKLIEIIIEK